MTFVMVVVFVIFAYVLIRYRQRPGDDHIPKQVNGNTLLEITWTAIPVLLITVLAIPTVMTTFSLSESYPEDEADREPMTAQAAENGLRVNVTAYTFWWEFDYPDLEINTANELYIPTNQRVYFELTSNDVIHSFWAPALAGKQDANPGIINPMYFEADEPGVYEGRCAELCGASHALMNFRVIALEPEEFEDWVQSMKSFRPEQASTDLAKQGRDLFQQSCIACHSLEADLRNPSGPNLALFANREMLANHLTNNPENLAKWIANPGEVKPGALMPGAPELGLSDEDIAALVEYLSQLN